MEASKKDARILHPELGDSVLPQEATTHALHQQATRGSPSWTLRLFKAIRCCNSSANLVVSLSTSASEFLTRVTSVSPLSPPDNPTPVHPLCLFGPNGRGFPLPRHLQTCVSSLIPSRTLQYVVTIIEVDRMLLPTSMPFFLDPIESQISRAHVKSPTPHHSWSKCFVNYVGPYLCTSQIGPRQNPVAPSSSILYGVEG